MNKPTGITSRRAVDIVKRLARPAKVGHAGTLDPLADGVLVICIGEATRLIEYVQRMPKRYRGTFLLGRSSPTEDVEGEVVELPGAPIPTLKQIGEAAKLLIGRIEQRPPIFSALKIKGRRAYELARAGEKVELAPRTINVHSLDVAEYDYPKLVLDIECGGGTYVRSLGRDLAESLGSAAVMSALTRTAVGVFQIEHSVDPDVLNDSDWMNRIVPPLRAVEYMPFVRLSNDQLARVRNGVAIELDNEQIRDISTAKTPVEMQGIYAEQSNANEEIAALDETGRLASIMVRDGADRARPKRNFGNI